MKFFNLFNFAENRKAKKLKEIEERRVGYGGIGALMFGGSSTYTQDKAMLLSTVYRCVNLIADSVAQLPFEPYKVDSKGFKKRYQKHSSYHVLNCEPNQRMTRFTFIKLLISSMLLRGNAYAYIVRDERGDVKELLYLPPEYVTIVPPKYIYEPVTYRVTGFTADVPAQDMIHLLNYTYDGVTGISTLAFAAQTLELASNSEEHARNFFAGGCNVGGILSVQSSLNARQKEDIKSSWNKAFSAKSGTSNGLAVLEGNMSYQPISVNSKDAQLLETRQFNVTDICRFFNVSPVMAFDLSKSSYSTVEATNISFLSTTLQPILTKIEIEFKRKIFREHSNIDVKFDVSELLRTDKASQSEYYQKMILNGIMSVNEVRRDLNLIPVEGGDVNFIAANLLSLSACASNIPANSAIQTPNETPAQNDEVNQEPETEPETDTQEEKEENNIK